MDEKVHRCASDASSLNEGENRRKKIFCQKRESTYFLKAGLYFAIAFLLIISVLFISNAGESNDTKTIVFNTVQPPVDASGEEGESIFDSSLIDPVFILGREMPVIYGVDIQEIYLEDQLSGTDIYFDVLPEEIKMDILRFTSDAQKQFFVSSQGPQILIYHTHTQEAYRQIAGEEYVETGSWRTDDESQSVVAVGEVLEQELEDYGYTVLHDTKNHEPPKLSTSYSRSLETMQDYARDHPNISVYIDVHRDAYGNVDEGKKDFVTVNGEQCARVMFVVGTGEGKTGSGFDEKPNYESNYKLALAITNELEDIKEGFTRPIRVKTGRYNQHVSDMCLLIEVGHNANSLEQALNTAKYIALALSRVLDVE